ncbi:hypothetical protein JS510_02625 [Mycoplasma tauri]|uniref:hypothetical protein n=1 Tax=Mycoplasma tauri TaxID=547987 RepID=UPI001967BC05|nr:hypothetical protein [Mycoplasma tauri]QSB07382.1 hypothetical protein JS510_02625 [Mycoplasma tauri]
MKKTLKLSIMLTPIIFTKMLTLLTISCSMNSQKNVTADVEAKDSIANLNFLSKELKDKLKNKLENSDKGGIANILTLATEINNVIKSINTSFGSNLTAEDKNKYIRQVEALETIEEVNLLATKVENINNVATLKNLPVEFKNTVKSQIEQLLTIKKIKNAFALANIKDKSCSDLKIFIDLDNKDIEKHIEKILKANDFDQVSALTLIAFKENAIKRIESLNNKLNEKSQEKYKKLLEEAKNNLSVDKIIELAIEEVIGLKISSVKIRLDNVSHPDGRHYVSPSVSINIKATNSEKYNLNKGKLYNMSFVWPENNDPNKKGEFSSIASDFNNGSLNNENDYIFNIEAEKLFNVKGVYEIRKISLDEINILIKKIYVNIN